MNDDQKGNIVRAIDQLKGIIGETERIGNLQHGPPITQAEAVALVEARSDIEQAIAKLDKARGRDIRH